MPLDPRHIEILEEIRGKLSDIQDELLPRLPGGRDVEHIRTNITDALDWVDATLTRGSLETEAG